MGGPGCCRAYPPADIKVVMDIACRPVRRVRRHYDVSQPFLSHLQEIAGVIALGPARLMNSK